jgi:hypothetical protein
MNKVLLIILSGLAIGLIQTNPRNKEDYLSHVSHQVHGMVCQLESSTPRTCALLSPIAIPMIKGALSLYTKPPKNYLLFTAYVTRLPGFDVYGIGIGGQFIVWSPQAIAPQDYEDLLDRLLNTRTNSSSNQVECDRTNDLQSSEL